jgi:Glycosyltransferase family 87
MQPILETLRSGAWVTRERMRLVALALLAASAVGIAFLLATSNGLNDIKGRPLGTDFANVYAAGTFVLDGEPGLPFDGRYQHAREQDIFGDKTPFYGWHYPPFFLFLAAALATMPYLLALAVWQGVTFALYLWAVWAILDACRGPPFPSDPQGAGDSGHADRLWLLLAAAYPAVFVNLGHGHNGFLTAALMGGGLVLLDRRPWLAGILFGLLAYKPQFGLMIPLVLIVTGHWRTVAAAAATVAALAVITTVAFGVDVWTAFIAGTRFTRVVVLEHGETGWYKIQSVFSVVRMWGGSIDLAYAIQAAVTVTVAAALVWLWRSRADYSLKAAALPIASILATPYSLDYDLMVLAPSITFLAMHGLRHKFSSFERTALAFVWIVPLVARTVAEAILVPLGVFAMLMLISLIMKRAAASMGFDRQWHLLQSSIK